MHKAPPLDDEVRPIPAVKSIQTGISLSTPLVIIYKATLIAVVALVLGLIIPAIIAHRGGVFYESTLISRLPNSAKSKLEEFETFQTEAKNQIKRIDEILLRPTPEPLDNVSNLMAVRSYYQNELSSTAAPIQVSPFYLNPIMLVWVFMYTSLGWLVFLLSPDRKEALKPFRRLTTLGIALGIYVFYQWTVWMRNFVLSNERRVIYSFANYDIYPNSFFAQEANTILFAVLLAVLWQQWSSHFVVTQAMLDQELHKKKFRDAAFDYFEIQRLSKTFIHWQVGSVVLALGFIDFTSGFWDLVVRRQDQRYLLAAIVIHCLWGITWILISLPLLNTWYHWQSLRVRALSEAMDHTSDPQAELTLKALNEIKPIGFWNVATSGVVALISFVLPIIQSFFK